MRWTPSGNIPTNTSQLSLINVTNLAGKAEATTTMTLQANLDSTSDGRFDLCRRRHDLGHGDAGLPAHHQCL